MTFILSRRAQRDIFDITSYLKQFDPSAAKRTALKIHETIRMLVAFHFAGRSRPEIDPGVRAHVIAPYVIFYRVEQSGIRIMRVWDGRRNPDDLDLGS